MSGPCIERGLMVWRNAAGKLHREDGPASINENGTERWFIDGILHREDGPAITYPDGTWGWYRHGKIHRIDGPAYFESGYEEWRIHGNEITDSVLQWIAENDVNPNWEEWTDADKVLFRLRFA